MSETIPEPKFESTPDITTKEGRTNLFTDVVNLYHEATKIREEAGFNRANLTNEELPGFTALHFTYGRLKKLLTELAYKAEQGEAITEEENALTERLDQRLQTYFDQLQNGDTTGSKETEELDTYPDNSEVELTVDNSLYETEVNQFQHYQEELERLSRLTTKNFLNEEPIYSQYSRNLQKYGWLLENLKDNPEDAVTLLVLENTQAKLEANYRQLKEIVETRRSDFEASFGQDIAEIADALSTVDTSQATPTPKRNGWWNSPDGKTPIASTTEDTSANPTEPTTPEPPELVPNTPADTEAIADDKVETTTDKTILGLQIPPPGRAGAAAAFVFRDEVLHTLALARLANGGKSSQISKNLKLEQKHKLAEVRNVVSQISPYAGLSRNQYEQLVALANNESIAEPVIGNPRFEKSLLGRTINHLGQKSKKALAIKLPSWNKESSSSEKYTNWKRVRNIIGSSLLAASIFPTALNETKTQDTTHDTVPEVTTTIVEPDANDLDLSDYPPNLPTGNYADTITANQVPLTSLNFPSYPENDLHLQPSAEPPEVETEVTPEPIAPATEVAPIAPQEETTPRREPITENLPDAPDEVDIYNEINIETTPHLPEYVVQKGDNLWNIALGKVEGVSTLPALANLSEEKQNQLLSELRQQLIENEEIRNKIGIRSHPDFIYYGDTSVPVPDGDKLSLEALNNTLEKLKNNN